ncbi:MAG TPA: inorganic phosphate transporter, partial [Gaiellaceae bacterium]
ISWNLITWYFGLPSSSSHALIGGVVGAAFAAAGSSAVLGDGVLGKVLIPAIIAPILAFIVGAVAIVICYRVVGRLRPGHAGRGYRLGQVVSGGLLALAHGTNDAQKTMGVITLALIVSGHQAAEPFHVPLWVKVSAATAMGLGTYAGGWRIIRTLGQRVAKLEPPQGFSAQTATAFLLWLTAHRGYPVSTTYVISGSVLGAGASTRLSAVRWGVAGNILVAWVITIPCAALVAAVMELITRLPGGVAYVFLLTGLIAGLAFAGRSLETRRLRAAAAGASA